MKPHHSWFATFLVLLWLLGAWADIASGKEPCAKPRVEHGIASFYWPDPNSRWGHHVAEGGYYDPSGLTAAHKTLPFSTRVKVTNLTNNRSLIVRINDRGPFIKGRVIDLTPAAARMLGITGLAKVKLEIVNRRRIPK